MARIGIDARYMENELTGIGRYSYNLLRHLLPSDPENQYWVFLRQDYAGPLPQGSNVAYLRVPHLPISMGSLLGMSLDVRRIKIDLWHAHFPVLPLFHGVPSVVTVHDLQPLRVPALAGRRPLFLRIGYRVYYSLAYRYALHRARAVVAVSQATRREVESFFRIPPEKIRVIHESLDDRFQEEGDLPQGYAAGSRESFELPERFLLYVGATLPHKNLANMIEGFSKALEQPGVADCFLVLAGRGSRFDEDWVEVARRLNVSHRIVRLGHVAQEDLPDLYRKASGLLYVTCFEGFGLPALESMYHGLPVIVAYHGSLPEVVGSAGIWTSPTDVEGIAEAIVRLLGDSSLQERLRRLGRCNLKRFSWTRAAEEIRSLFEKILSDAQP